jgi:hypothetical protein
MMFRTWENPTTMVVLQIPRASQGSQAAKAKDGSHFHPQAMLTALPEWLQSYRACGPGFTCLAQCQRAPLPMCCLLQKAVQSAVRVAPAASA